MRISALLALALSAIIFAACDSNSAPIAGPTHNGWINPQKKKLPQQLFVSDNGDSVIDIYSVPNYSLIGQITDGISQPDGIATDRFGNLYVANLGNDTITVYAQGATTPLHTLTEPNGPDDVAVGKFGAVFAADIGGGVDVYDSPTSISFPNQRLTDGHIFEVFGVALDRNDDVYAAGLGPGSEPVVVTYHHDSAYRWAPGVNLYLTGMSLPTGMIIHNAHDNIFLVESDYGRGVINTYQYGATIPSKTIAVAHPERSSLDKAGNLIYVPRGSDNKVDVLKYPRGTEITSISVGNFVSGTAVLPAPKP
jgi:hypothetical protein